METDKIIIKKNNNGKITVKEDGRKTISPYNNVKHLKYAKSLPAECNDCRYRAKDMGGRGGCPKYEEDATCAIRKDLGDLIEQFDTRDPEDLKGMLGIILKEQFENLMMAMARYKMDGNIPDKSYMAEINAFANQIKVLNELMTKTQSVTVSQKEVVNAEGIKSIFRSITEAKTDNGSPDD